MVRLGPTLPADYNSTLSRTTKHLPMAAMSDEAAVRTSSAARKGSSSFEGEE